MNSYAYYIQDEYKSPTMSRADFLRTLSRERFEPNDSMKLGIKLEDDILRATQYECNYNIDVHDDKIVQYDAVVNALADLVRNGLWQQTCKKDLQVGNNTFLLCGRMDVVKRDTVYDIKFTSNYELGKFLDSSQHLIYLYCTELPNFQYLISDGKDYWVEYYFNNLEIEDKIKSKINDFMSYLENDKEAKEMYFAKWESK